ncbi:thiol reductant ABC exporter subunit CydC [Marinobacter xestospongiae]|uniref:thiol reductant ABC exporter subunit CydC n=1 Tax=Marinobacter xestospongiae TaxID=994319 RepID=UPI002003869C|nr:thiol reductant ABC exporter subunit CydC [Marinobacter xestospongiae]MCK7566248.1 thiol reductant ABC exporter subunit CydC [Marinobacter xestospongiae]
MSELLPWLRVIQRRRSRLLVGAGLILLTLLSGLGLLALSGWFITATAVTGLLLAAGIQASLDIYTPGGGIRGFAVTRTVARYLERLYNHDTVLQLLADVRIQLFRGLARQSYRHLRSLRGADWLNRLTTDLDAMDSLYLRLIAPTALALLVSVGLVLVAWWLVSPLLALALAVLLAAGFLVATVLLHLRTGDHAAAIMVQQADLRAATIEHLEGQAELRAAGLLPQQQQALSARGDDYMAGQVVVDTRTAWHQALAGVLVNLAALTALVLGLQQMAAGAITGPVAVILPLALLGLVEVYGQLPEAFGRLGATVTSAARLNRDSGPLVPGSGSGRERAGDSNDRVQTGICLRNADIGPAGLEPVLKGLTLTLEAGDWLGIVGRSGSGKSSLADALAGCAPLAAGQREGVPAARVAYLTQQTTLLDDTLRANLVPDGRPVSDETLWRVLELVGLGERIAASRGRLDTWLGAYGSKLSGGEARRVALARVLLHPADLVILDEPFTGLDRATRERICQQLPAWLEGRTVVVLAHDEDALVPVRQVIHLDQR